MNAASVTGAGHPHAWSLLHGWRIAHPATHRRRRVVPHLAAHERVLSRVDLLGGGVVVGTQRAMYLRDGHTEWRRIAWPDIARAGWSRATASTVLLLWPVDGTVTDQVCVPSGTGFAAFAAERVSSTQVLCRRVQLTPTSAATITALREPEADSVTWRVRLDADADADGNDPAVAVAAERALADLRALTGG